MATPADMKGIDAELLERFRKAAKAHRRNPERMLREYMVECLEIWEDQDLDEEISRDVQRNGLREEDVEEFVRQVRSEMRERRAAS